MIALVIAAALAAVVVITLQAGGLWIMDPG